MSQRKNALLICTDHWFSSLFGHRGHDLVLTPTLDQLAHSGTVFDNAYAECPVCMPARRSIMTGTTPRWHGDRQMVSLPMSPELPTLAQTFRDNGYQAMAVGKLHVYPQRDRIGFDDVILSEEGRVQHGVTDDYEAFLAKEGYPGEYMCHGMSNNQYHTRPWHLPEHTHPTNWATQEMCRLIKRRDPTRPGFWYLSYVHPHPPLTPLNDYLDMYRDVEIPEQIRGAWSDDVASLPLALRQGRHDSDNSYNGKRSRELALKAFYALCTHIDHQLRLVIGTLREEGLLEDTVLMFTSDHGDMLGDHGIWAKRVFYEKSANVPMLLVAPKDDRVAKDKVDHRLTGHRDIMPTLLELCGVEVPSTVEGLSLATETTRPTFYGEWGEGVPAATRMIRDDRYKLLYYPVGNHFQLFDLQTDPDECNDLAPSKEHADAFKKLQDALASELYRGDEAWVVDGEWVGLPASPWEPKAAHPSLGGQRGTHFPMPSLINP